MTDATLNIRVNSSEVDKGKRSLDDLARSGTGAEKATGGAAKATKGLGEAARVAAGFMGPLVAALGARQIIQYADAWTSAENKLRVVTNSTAQLSSVQQALLKTANESRSAFEDTATLYSRLALSTTELGLSQSELVDLTSTITKSFALNGATAAEASGAITQLSQGLAAGALRGQEYNSVLEQAPGIARAIAASLGLTLGELRAFANEGKITAEVVVKALQEASGTIDEQFGESIATFGQKLTLARNNLVEFAGGSDELKGTISGLGDGIVLLSDHVDELSAGVIAVSAAMATRYVPAVLSAAAGTGSLVGWLGALTGPAGLIALTAGGLYLLVKQQESSADAAWEQARAFEEVLSVLGQLTEAELVSHAVALNNDIETTQASIREKERLLSTLNPLSDAYISVNEQIRLLRVEETAQLSNQKTVIDQLRRVQAGWKGAGSSIDDAGDSTGELNEKSNDLVKKLAEQIAVLGKTEREAYLYGIRLESIATGASPAATEAAVALAAAYYDQKTAIEEAEQAAKDGAKAQEDAADEAARAAKKAADEHARAAQLIAEDYRELRNELSDIWQDVISDADNVGDIIEGIFKRTALSIAGDFAAALTLDFLGANPTGQAFSLAGSLTNAGAAGKIIGAGLGKFAPGIAGSLGIGGAAITAEQAAALNLPASAASGGLLSGVGSFLTNPLTLGIGGIALAASLLDKKSTPSYNAGFITDPNLPLGKSGQSFSVDPFESGVTPTGFYRRSSAAEAMQVIDAFRALDSQITSTFRDAGIAFSATNANLRGYAETGLGTGSVFGAAGEEGRPGTALDVQLNNYAKQLIASAAGTLSGDILDSVINAGDANAMVAALHEAIGTTEEVADSAETLTKSLRGLNESIVNLYGSTYYATEADSALGRSRNTGSSGGVSRISNPGYDAEGIITQQGMEQVALWRAQNTFFGRTGIQQEMGPAEMLYRANRYPAAGPGLESPTLASILADIADSTKKTSDLILRVTRDGDSLVTTAA